MNIFQAKENMLGKFIYRCVLNVFGEDV
jgi:hypothetical protein